MKKFFPDCHKGEFNPNHYNTYYDMVLENLGYTKEGYLYRVTYELDEYYALAKDFADLVEAVKYHNDIYGKFGYNMEIIRLDKNEPDVDWEDINKYLRRNYYKY